MRIEPERVYLYRRPVDSAVLPSAAYQDLAYAALSRLDLELPADGTIAIKPNITIPAGPETRIVTHPGFVVGILRRLLDLGVPRERLVVMEGYGRRQEGARSGSGWHHPHPHRHRLHYQLHPEPQFHAPAHGPLPQASGYEAALGELGLPLTNHDECQEIDVPVPGGVIFRQLRFPHHSARAGLLLNVPVAKCHNLSCTTLCTKNLQGLVLSPQRHMCGIQAEDEGVPAEELARIGASGLSLHEERFCHKHADLLAAVRHTGVPRLCVVDGLVGRDGTAFNEGRNHPLGWTVIGVNEVHVDAVATYLFGLDPEQTPYLRVAAQRGLGSNRVSDLEVVDLATGQALAPHRLAACRHQPALMPLCRYGDGYYARFRADGSVVPWALDRVNQQRRADGLEPIPAC
ncbi:MAG: DUF362 domain-containing protein [Candidatus Latescibacterota bacterium]